MNLWRIEEDRPRPLAGAGIGEEKRLESIIADDVKILGLGQLMLLGRQVATDYGARIDLLALDEEGTLYVIELKRARTPREVVAQVLDYGSWVRGVSAENLARIFEFRSLRSQPHVPCCVRWPIRRATTGGDQREPPACDRRLEARRQHPANR